MPPKREQSVTDPFFTLRPIGFLNGCETGTMGGSDRQFGGTPFQSIFLSRGARAVVVTEAPIWWYFGYAMGVEYLDNLKAGKDASEALYEARRDFLDGKNPFGLLYSLYGNGGARLKRN
jgi:hypothetical protein